MCPNTEILQPGPEPLAAIDYDHIRAIAVIERRKAIYAFPSVVYGWTKSVFQRLFSTLRSFRGNSPGHGARHQNLWPEDR